MLVPINNVSAKKNIRQVKSDTSFDNLCTDIKNDGLLTPITVYEEQKGKFTVIAGHRRLAACQTVGLKEIDVKCIYPKPTDEQITKMQINENLLRSDLNLFEEVMAFKSMAETSNSVQDICDKFGHSPKYVQQRLNLGNLVPELLQPYFVTQDNKRRLMSFANSHPKVQHEAIDHCRTNMCITKNGDVECHAPVSKKQGKVMTRKQYLEYAMNDENWLRHTVDFFEYPKLSYNTIPKETLVQVCGTEEKLRELEKEYGYKQMRTVGLFSEFVETDYCTDSDFQIYIISQIYPEILKQLEDCPVKPIEKYESGCTSGHWYDMFQRPYIDTPDGIKKNVASWNGDILYPVMKEKTVSDKTTSGTKTERPRYYGISKKFGKVIVPQYVAYLRENTKKIINDNSLEWCLKNSEINLSNLDHWDKGFKFRNLIKKLPVGERYKTKVFTGVFLGAYILESLYQAEIKNLSKLAKVNDLLTLKEWFQESWIQSEDFRYDVLGCFSLRLLQEYNFAGGKGSKKELVTFLSQTKGDGKPYSFKFNDLFKTTEETGWTELSSVYYFNKQEYYSLKSK